MNVKFEMSHAIQLILTFEVSTMESEFFECLNNLNVTFGMSHAVLLILRLEVSTM